MLDAVDSMIAARSAMRALTRAEDVAVPRIFGREAALGVVGDQLLMAGELLATGASGVRPDAAEAARLLDEAASGVRQAAGAAQARDGAKRLGSLLERPRSLADQAFETLRAQGIDTLDDDVVDAHLALRRGRGAMDAVQWERLADSLERSERVRELVPSMRADLAREAAELHRATGEVPPSWEGWAAFDEARANVTFRTPQTARARLLQVADQPEASIGTTELADIAALARKPAGLRPAGLRVADAETFAGAATRRAQGRTLTADWEGWTTLRRIAADVQFPDAGAANARADELLRAGYDAIDADGWRDLQRLRLLPADRTPAAFTADAPLEQLDVLAAGARGGSVPAPDWAGWNELDTWRASLRYETREAATARLDELLAPGSTLSRDDLHEFNGIVGLPRGRRPAALDQLDPDAIIRQLTNLRAKAGSLGGGGAAPDWRVFRQLDAVRADLRYATREETEQRLRDIILRPREELDAADLHDLSGLIQLTDGRQPAGLRGSSVGDFSYAAELRRAGSPINADWGGWKLLDTIEAAARWPTSDAAQRDLVSLLGSSYEEMTPERWTLLARMSQLPTELRPASLPATTELNAVANAAKNGSEINAKWNGWRQLNKARAQATFTSREAADARLAQIVDTPQAELTRRDLHDLDGLLQLGDDTRPSALDGTTLTTIAEAAELRGRGRAIASDWGGWDTLGGIRIAKRYPTADSARAAAATALGRSYDDMDGAAWRTLADISLLPAEQRPAQLVHANGTALTRDLRTVADLVETGKPAAATWGGWRPLNKLRAETRFTTREQAQARLTELVNTSQADLTRQDLHDLDGLLQLGDDVRPQALAGSTLSSAAEAAELRGAGKAISDTWGGWDVLTGIRLSTKWPDAASALSSASEALGRSYDDMDPAAWRTLADLSMLPAQKRPSLLVHANGTSLTSDLRQVASLVEGDKAINKTWGGFRQLNRLRAEALYATREQADSRLAQIVSKDPSALTRQDLHDLDGLMQLGDDRRPALLNGATIANVAEAAELRGAGSAINGSWDGWNLLAGIRAAKDWPTREAAQEAAISLLGHRYEDMTPQAWRSLADMSTLPADIRPELLRKSNGASITTDLRTVAANLEQGTAINAQWDGWRQLNRMRAEATWNTRELAELRLREIAARGRDQLTRQDLHDLDGLIQLPGALRPASLTGATTLTNAAEAAELRGSNRAINAGWQGWQVLDALGLELTLPADAAGREAWVRTELTKRLSGQEFDPVLGTILRLRPDLIPADLRSIGQLAIANEMLRDIATVGVTSYVAPKPALEAAKLALEGLQGASSAATGVDGIARQTLELTDRNLARIDGISKGPIAGFSRYADLAEVGRIRSNLELLERVTPRPALPEVEAPAAPTVDAVAETAGDTLTW